MSTVKKTNRVSKKIIANVSNEDAQNAAKEFTSATNLKTDLETKMNTEMDAVKENYSKQIEDQAQIIQEKTKVLQAYANEQKGSWGKKKSCEFLWAIIGFRTGNKEVVKPKNITWDDIVKLMKEKVVFSGFIRKKEEVNKEAILNEKNEAVLNQLKEDCQLKIKQAETFFVTPKIEEVKS